VPRWESPWGAAREAAGVVMAWHVPFLLRYVHAGAQRPDRRRILLAGELGGRRLLRLGGPSASTPARTARPGR
jgi:hypothetical protein